MTWGQPWSMQDWNIMNPRQLLAKEIQCNATQGHASLSRMRPPVARAHAIGGSS